MMTTNSFRVGQRVLIPRGVGVRTGISTKPVFWVKVPGYRAKIAKIVPNVPSLVIDDVVVLPAAGRSICWWRSGYLYSASIDDILATTSSDVQHVGRRSRVPRDLTLLILTTGGNDVY